MQAAAVRYPAKVTAFRCQLVVSLCRACTVGEYGVTDGLQYVDTPEAHTFRSIISVTVQLWIQVFWVISIQFNRRNTLPKICPFLLGHTVHINCTNIPPIMIINRIYETHNLLSQQLVSFLVSLRTYQNPCTNFRIQNTHK